MPLLGVLLRIAFGFIGRLLPMLGFAAVSMVGVSAGFDYLKTVMAQNLGNLPAVALDILSILQIDKCLGLILSGYMFKLVKSGIVGAGGVAQTVRKIVRR